MSRDFLPVIPEGTCEFRRLVQFILADAVYNNVLTNCAALLSPRGPSLALRAIHLVPRLRKLTHMCSRTISGTVYRFRHGSTLCSPTVEKILCRSPFRSGHMSAICARLSNKGKTGVQRGRETAGVPSFLPTAVGTALSQPRVRQSPALRRAQLLAEFQRKTLCPLGTNTLAQFEYPAQPVLRNAA